MIMSAIKDQDLRAYTCQLTRATVTLARAHTLVFMRAPLYSENVRFFVPLAVANDRQLAEIDIEEQRLRDVLAMPDHVIIRRQPLIQVSSAADFLSRNFILGLYAAARQKIFDADRRKQISTMLSVCSAIENRDCISFSSCQRFLFALSVCLLSKRARIKSFGKFSIEKQCEKTFYRVTFIF